VFFSLYNTNWYCNNYSLIDIVDTAIMFVIIYDTLIIGCLFLGLLKLEKYYDYNKKIN